MPVRVFGSFEQFFERFHWRDYSTWERRHPCLPLRILASLPLPPQSKYFVTPGFGSGVHCSYQREIHPRQSAQSSAVYSAGLNLMSGLLTSANRSAQLIRAVDCITTNNVMIEPIVTASPVKPSKKNA